MAMSMGEGGCVYLLKKGHPAKRRNLVDAFDRAPESSIAPVADQEKFYEEWLASLK
jgi:hypothetical protein